ncbi:16S rRNA (uracil(1498)-N(3))-methyltransferase [Chlorogloea sp. CCALA 695]|uniref:16S rRNA (uracil(1498)-N(3))-methyltransferase n=1 Tax=Chlorogloea sp. CCALA 695 TaxID=2107693 RepID=UPI000D075348|nr:16S rRNA (uracil(1498)-N(3))-methyltransferase [Chlorogloea sp. CCALA 695]PSB32018.1 16S rRNA (uracil(1498)-N(3))-methyltransferase [Chlorogloea sp. CCALA 695]
MAQLQRLAIAFSQLQDKQILLKREQLHYLSHVLRLKEGESFIAMDGQGNSWLAALEAQQGRILEPLEVTSELPIAITLIAALPKGNGFDEVVRCCTELGVTTIMPVIGDRTILNPSPQKLERWRRIATEAAEQSERAIIPAILEPVAFSSAISTISANYRYLCVARGEHPHLLDAINSGQSGEIAIAIGCEGGWTGAEIDKAMELGFQKFSLGSRILRAVTAPIVALSIVAAAFETDK